jgi:Raf kinase inhibitor-like YbhB/YbcL family protein
MKIESNAFQSGGKIPQKYGYKKDNINPAIIIKDVPPEAKSLVLIMDDPDAIKAVGKIWVHWVIWNINPTTSEIQEDSIPPNSVQGKTDFGEIAYGGPAPPDKEHTYFFKLYALDDKLILKEGSTKLVVEEAMKNHIITETKLEGRFAP